MRLEVTDARHLRGCAEGNAGAQVLARRIRPGELGGASLRILVCGSRTWKDGNAILVRLKCCGPPGTVITGGARGADQLAENIARQLGFDVETFPADWRGKGRRAGIIRNLAMLDTEPDVVIAFQENGSRGTQHTIDEARSRGVRLWIVQPS